jgi:ribosomal protein L40E
MSFFKDLKINAEAAAACAGDTLMCCVELAKVKVEIARINRKLREDYTVLGRRVFHTGLDDVKEDGSILEMVEEIRTLRENRRRLDLRVAELKDVSVCTECGGENPKSVSNCLKCGQRLH